MQPISNRGECNVKVLKITGTYSQWIYAANLM